MTATPDADVVSRVGSCVDRERLREDIETNGRFGAVDAETGRGRTVLTGSEADRKAREYFVERLRDAGLDVRVDPVGNVAGRWVPPEADPDAAAVAAGSHLDSVPRGGIFDGPLGVYGALEAVRALQDAGCAPSRPVEVVSFSEEEGGRLSIGLLGSAVATGARDAETTLGLEDDEGVSFGSRLDSIGFRGSDRVDPAEWDSWVELHIEQGSELESAGRSVGVVTSISGITNCRVAFDGEADHAGATPMFERRDALAAASEFVLDLERAARERALDRPAAVGTVGSLSLEPNARNAVPGRVVTELDIRDTDYESMDAIVDRARRCLGRLARERGVETSLERYRDQRPSAMSDRATDVAADVAEELAVPAQRMHSPALHDTANVADHTETAMLFAPSVDGISHNPREWTDWADCAAATRVLAGTLAVLAD